MRGIFVFFLGLLFYEVASTAYYFHEPSHVQLTSPDGDKDFGSTLNYHIKTDSLVVGAPRSDLNGKVFTCPLTDIAISPKTKMKCKRANINIDQLAEEFRKPPIGLPDQHCHLGASIAVTDDNIFTCAPLCSKHIHSTETNNSSELGAFGTCFVYDGQNAQRYSGLFEMYKPELSMRMDPFYGGVGWTTFSDSRNNLILIAKYIFDNYITYLDMDHLLLPVMEKNMPKKEIPEYAYKGVAFTAGIFFSDKKYLYAFSMKKFNHCGGIAFMNYNKATKNLEILNDSSNTRAILIRDPNSISMYGTALHSADLNNDKFSELIVGAPAFSTVELGYELGAIYLYKGGGKVVERTKPTHRIVATKEAARFGTSIASIDLDGDGFAEIFVGAPYGENEGTVYILFGNEIRKLLELDTAITDTLLSSLKHTQTLLIKNFKTFGYSLHAFQRNGTNLLAVGSPSTGTVVLYRSLSLVTVSMSMRVLGDKSLREQDTNFTVIVNVKLANSEKFLNSFKLFLSTEVTGDQANIEGNTTNEIELSTMNPESTSNIVVLLNGTGPGDYKITAKVFDKEPYKQKDYDTSSVQLTPLSDTTSVLEVPRHCKGSDCVPDLETTIEWSGGSGKYILGSNPSETMQLTIYNKGNSTYDSCAWIKVTGAQIAVLECPRTDTSDGIWYKCPLQIERNDYRLIFIRLEMSRPTNKYKSLNIEVHIFNRCASVNSNATDIKKKEITYTFNNDDVKIEGSSFNRNFTDSEIHDDVPNAKIKVHESYKITNTANMSWYKVAAVLKYQDLSFFEKYTILGKECNKNRSNGFVEMKCIIDIDSMSEKFIFATATLSKSKLVPHLTQRKLVLNSTLELHFESATSKIAYYTTTIFVQRDEELWENQFFLIGVSVIAAIVIVGILVLILYKIGFFERKKKKKSKTLRESFRRPSTQNKTEVQEVHMK